ncbi:MAG: hypothetical protein ABIR68_13705 [Ilumatobacteraceae bacterium]
MGGVGILPSTVDTEEPGATDRATSSIGPSTTSGASSTTGSTVAESTTVPGPSYVGARAPGNRILMIGDSVLASTSRRYSNDMCKALVPMGWKVELDAEVGRFIDFGKQVLDKRLSAGWDVGVIFLGNNYGDNPDVFTPLLTDLVDRLSPNPVVLVSVTEFKASRTQVNAAIQAIADTHPNVTILDWASISTAAPGLLGGDGLHLTPSGRNSLAVSMAATLGAAPSQPGDCLTTGYRNDSAGNVNTGTTAPVRPPRVTVKPTTQPTTKPVTPTTAGGGSATTTTAKPVTGTTATPQTTAPPTTAEPVKTSAPTTAAPVPTPKPTTAPTQSPPPQPPTTAPTTAPAAPPGP